MTYWLRAGERAAFVGLPGYGKTRLMWALLEAGGRGGRPISSVVVIDTKLDPREWANWGPAHGYVVGGEDLVRRAPLVIWQVDQRQIEDRGGWARPGRLGYRFTRGLDAIMDRGYTVVVFDEGLQSLTLQPHPSARRIITQGRSKGVSSWVGTQRPRWVDPFSLKLAEHCFAFSCPDEDDRDYLRGLRGAASDALATLEIHSFAYHRQGQPSWEICPPVEVSGREFAGVAGAPGTEPEPPSDSGNAALTAPPDPWEGAAQ